MVKKIRLLGMEMDHFSLREEIARSETFYREQGLHIIRTIEIGMLSMAAGSEAVRAGIAQADLLVVGDRGILIEAGIYSAQRLRDAGEHMFMREFLSRTDSSRSVFLVAQDGEALGSFREFLGMEYENMRIVGNYLLDADAGRDGYDMMVNEINASAPDTILSVLDSPQEDAFLLQERAKISAKVWYSLGADYQNTEKKTSFLFWLRQLIHRGRLKNVIHQYEAGQ